MNYNDVRCIAMQEVIGWLLFLGISYVAWRLYRALRRSYRNAVAMRAEAQAHAISDAVAQGMAAALSAAVADANASSSVNVHIGDNLARILANHYDDDAMQSATHDRNIGRGRTDVGRMSDAARHGELASGRTLRSGIADRTVGGNVRSTTLDSGEVA